MKPLTQPFGKLAKPAQRALTNAGITSLDELCRVSEKDLMQLHGFGKNGLQTLKVMMEEKGLSFKA
jgi:DNA-directed RNA polymerase alpha subunit